MITKVTTSRRHKCSNMLMCLTALSNYMFLVPVGLDISYDFSPDTNFNRHLQTTNVSVSHLFLKKNRCYSTHWASSCDSLAFSYRQATKKWAEKTMFICRPISETKDPLCRPEASEFNSKSTKTLEAWFSLFSRWTQRYQKHPTNAKSRPNPTEQVSQGILCMKQSV